MKGKLFAAAVILAATLTPAESREPSIWVQCDGQAKPEGAATAAARLATVTLLGGFGIGLLALPEPATGAPVAGGADGVAACTAALADPVLEPFWERKINILRARASHYVDIDKPDLALKDLEAAAEVGRGRPSSVLFDRSVGVSVKLFEATLRARAGEHDKADALAIAAADARPYSQRIQQMARSVLSTAPVLGAEERRIIERQRQIDPYTSSTLAFRLDTTDERDAAADAWEAALKASLPPLSLDADADDDAGTQRPPSAITLARATLAMLRAGRLERARELEPQYKKALEEPAPVDAAQGSTSRSRQDLARASADRLLRAIDEIVRKSAKSYEPLIDTLMKERSGDVAGAAKLAQEKFAEFPASMAGAEMLQRLNANPATAADVPAFLVQSALSKARPSRTERALQVNLKTLNKNLPAFGRVDGGARYRPGATVGYRSEPEKDKPGQTRIRYNGAQSVFAREEMMLLRAAEVTRDAGKESFVVERALGASIVISFADATSDPARVLKAADVLAALKPIYIDIPAALEAERRR